jgi:hypothetical protein
LAFALDSASDLPAEVTEAVLVRDTLESATDGITTDPRLTGMIANYVRMLGLAIEFNHDGDGWPTENRTQARRVSSGICRVGLRSVR